MRSTGRSPGSSQGIRALRASRPAQIDGDQIIVGFGMNEYRPAREIQREHIGGQLRIQRARQHGAAIAHPLKLRHRALCERQNFNSGIERLRHPDIGRFVEDRIDVAANERFESLGMNPGHAAGLANFTAPAGDVIACEAGGGSNVVKHRDADCDPAPPASGCAASACATECPRSATVLSPAVRRRRIDQGME